MSDVPPDEIPDDLADLLIRLTDSVEGLREDFRAQTVATERKFITAAEAVVKVNEAILKVDRNGRRSYWTMAAVVAVAAIGFGFREYDRNAKEKEKAAAEVEALVANCHNSNTTRAVIVGMFGQMVNLFDVYTVALGDLQPAPTPEAQAQKTALVNKLRTDFAAKVPPIPPELGSRDCSVEAVTTPTTFPPSSTIVAG